MSQILKVVEFQGETLTLPSWVNFLVVSSKGSIIGWNSRPRYVWRINDWATDNYLAREEVFGKILVPEGFNWKDSCSHVDSLPVKKLSDNIQAEAIGVNADISQSEQSFNSVANILIVVGILGFIFNYLSLPW